MLEDAVHRHCAGRDAAAPPTNAQPPIRVVSVDDHLVFREGLRAVIAAEPGMVLVGTADDVSGALTQLRVHVPDVVLADLGILGNDPAATIRRMRVESPRARIAVLGHGSGRSEIHRALRVGAAAYLFKSLSPNELLHAIRVIHSGRQHVPEDVALALAEQLGDRQLTRRELAVLGLIRDGRRNKQIADDLRIAETTVNFHIKNLVAKLRAQDRTHAVMTAIRRGVLTI